MHIMPINKQKLHNTSDCIFFLQRLGFFPEVYNGLFFFFISLCLHCIPIFFQFFKHNTKFIKLFLCSRPFCLPVLCLSSACSSLTGCSLIFCTTFSMQPPFIALSCCQYFFIAFFFCGCNSSLNLQGWGLQFWFCVYSLNLIISNILQ